MTSYTFDPKRKFVRVNELRSDGFVEFDFAIGEPELFVELIMPPSAFDDFCKINKVTFIDENRRLQVGDEGISDWNWSLRDATQHRLK